LVYSRKVKSSRQEFKKPLIINNKKKRYQLSDLINRLKRKYLSEEAPTNAMGTSSSTSGSGPVDTFDTLMKLKNKILKRKSPVDVSIKNTTK
jgi:hypothetical protein